MATATKERPILFSGPMVRAILEGRKTQTRRVVKLSDDWLDHCDQMIDLVNPDVFWRFSGSLDGGTKCEDLQCPCGRPGDRLWIKEGWRVGKKHDALKPKQLEPRSMTVLYAAGGSASFSGLRWQVDPSWPQEIPDWAGRYRSSRFMPRWASRIDLEITGLRVERLQDISEDDAEAEGCNPAERVCDSCRWIGTWEELGNVQQGDGDDVHRCPRCGGETDGWYLDEQFRKGFRSLWQKINGPESWAANPWVWVIEFKRVGE